MGHAGSGLHGSRSLRPGDRPDLSRPVGECRLADGTSIRFRPIEPTDASAYETMLCRCSPKSLYSRYERLITATPREMAEELCQHDPDCELTVVAEISAETGAAIVGMAQLLSDPNHEAAEYAVLVADPWQGQGLGGALTSFCLGIAHEWGIGRVIAEFLPDNMRMIRILETRKFNLHRDSQEHVVSGQKVIGGAGRPTAIELTQAKRRT
ncbi:GNAT family N-acetyltransferase [Candidatus Bipolaricaulota bacterium]